MSPRSAILFLTHRVPYPPDKGDKIRTFHELDRLAARHDVYCACFADDPQDLVHSESLKHTCKEIFVTPWRRSTAKLRAAAALVSGRPLTLAAYDSAEMHRRIAAWSADVEFDSAVAFSACMAPYALAARARRRVLDLCDADSEKWFDYARGANFALARLYAEEGRRLRAYEVDCLRRFDATVVISERERALLEEDDPATALADELLEAPEQRRIHIIPNGVELPRAAPPPASRRGPRVTFVGAMDYRPNVEGVCWFVRNVWPMVRAAIPMARLSIVGRNPVRAVRRLAVQRGVTVTGEVPDVRPYLAASRVVVAPLLICRGQPNKVLEAMAMRRPVVGTPAVAESIDATFGRRMLVGQAAAAFARQIVRLCFNRRLCDEVAEAGYRFVAINHSWTQAMQRYEEIVLDADTSPRREWTAGSRGFARPEGRGSSGLREYARPEVRGSSVSVASARELLAAIESQAATIEALNRRVRSISNTRPLHGRYRFSHLF